VKRLVARPFLAARCVGVLNDRSSALALLATRRSAKPRELDGPGPSREELDQILTIAARVPDHGMLTPWRFVVVAEDQRDALEAVLQDALLDDIPEATAARRQKEHDFAHYAGQLIVLVSAPVRDHKIPVWEQQLSCGAAGMNLLLAADALGYAGGWVTGWRAYSERVRRAFCNEGERIAGFVFIGHPLRELEERNRPALDQVARTWRPPAP
jgi:nitroreductase